MQIPRSRGMGVRAGRNGDCRAVANVVQFRDVKPIPRDSGSFLAIRTANPQMMYVGKAAHLHRLLTSGRSCVSLARRFVEGTVARVEV